MQAMEIFMNYITEHHSYSHRWMISKGYEQVLSLVDYILQVWMMITMFSQMILASPCASWKLQCMYKATIIWFKFKITK